MTSISFVPGYRGSTNILHDGHRYSKDKTYLDNTYWKCVKGHKKKWRERDAAYQRLVDNYDFDDILTFLDAISRV